MPITVKHGSGIEALVAGGFGAALGAGREETQAQLSRSAGIVQTTARIGASRDMQTQQLREQRSRQMEQIEAAADRQRQAADDAMARTAMQFGLTEQIKEDEFNRQISKMQEAARIQAQQTEWKFSAEDRREFARNNTADRAIDNSDLLSAKEKVIAHREVELRRMGITGGAVPADPNKQIFPEGQGIGKSWKDKFGNVKTRKPDGEEITQVKFPETPEGIQLKHKQAMELKNIERRTKLEDKIAAERAKIAGTLIEKLDKEGKQIGERYPTPAEVWERLSIAYPPSTWPRRGDQPQEQQQAPQAQPAPARPPVVHPQATEALDKAVSDIDLKFTEADQDLPERVRVAQAFLRVAKERNYFNRKVSPLMEKAIAEALQIGVEYNAAR